jgi:hypothetical protein
METNTYLDEAFDPAVEEGTPDLAPVPAGSYVAQITDAVVKPFKSGKGQAVFLTWEVMGGKYDGRKIFAHYTLSHESDKAMKFGRQKFKDVCTACRITNPVQDLGELYHKPCMIAVRIEDDPNGEYAPKNQVGRVKPIAEGKASNGATPFNDAVPF